MNQVTETLFSIDPQLEFQAILIIDNLSKLFRSELVLEGVTDLLDNTMEIWYRDLKTKTIVSKVCKINYNLWDSKKMTKYKENQKEMRKQIQEQNILNSKFFEKF